MKLKKYLFFLFICMFFSACSDDKNDDGGGGGGKEERPETLVWIEDTMREHYYWYEDIPKADKLNYKSGEKDFFYSLLSSKDGKKNPYSYFEESINSRTTIQENYSYGFEFTVVNFGTETNPEYRALILFVLPNSPASEANLERGDWIIKINGNSIKTVASYYSFLGDGEKTFTVTRWDSKLGQFNPETGKMTGAFKDSKEVKITSARKIVDDPVLCSNVIIRGNKNIGYLLYNHFTDGISDGDKTYDNKLRTISSSFYEKGVNEFVLDLRYNNGGLLSSAMLLCTILSPSESIGERLGYLRYNDKQKAPNSFFVSDNDLLNPGGKNLNLKRLYVLTSSATASSSEMVINSLRVFMDVIVIGDKTEGKNVGSVTYPTKEKPYPHGEINWSLHPIVCQISNKNNFTEYSEGFTPGLYEKNKGLPKEEGVYIDEAFEYEVTNNGRLVDLLDIYPLGEENERMLKVALEMIDGTYKATSTRSSDLLKKSAKQKIFNSIDRKAINSIILDINP